MAELTFAAWLEDTEAEYMALETTDGDEEIFYDIRVEDGAVVVYERRSPIDQRYCIDSEVEHSRPELPEPVVQLPHPPDFFTPECLCGIECEPMFLSEAREAWAEYAAKVAEVLQ